MGVRERLSQKPSLPLFLSCESAVIDTTAARKLPCPLQSVSGSTEHRLSHGLWCQHRPWTSAWFPVAVQTVVINLGLNMDRRHHHGFRWRHRYRHPHGLWWEHGPQTSTWCPMGTRTTDNNMASYKSMDHRHQHDLL